MADLAPTPLLTPGALPAEGRLRDRFELIEKLGSGGMGSVFAVRDRAFGDTVALKVTHSTSPHLAPQFKREFRAVADLRHPNLAELYELFAEAEPWCYTMELVPGRGLVDAVSPFSRPNVVAGTLLGVAQGIAALHDAGYLHRDVKPSNVQVTPAGRVVVLDTGLAIPIAWGTLISDAVGTPGYMSAEVRAGRFLAASDWYAFGVLIAEVLTGVLPTSTRPRLPEPFGELVAALLDEAPERRPDGEAILAELHRIAGRPRGPAPRLPSRAFVDREQERAWLAARLAGTEGALLEINGQSGMGKTALVEHALAALAHADGTALLRSRCRAGEYAPFKAIDPIVDALGSIVVAAPALARAAPLGNTSSLLQVFPALRRLAAIVPTGGSIPWDPARRRAAAFAALSALLSAVAATRRLVLWVDDAQWIDVDSLALLGELAAGTPSMLLIVTQWEPTPDPGLEAAWARVRAAFHRVERRTLGPLSEADAEAMVAALGGARPDAEALREAGGVPFLVDELGRVSDGPAEGFIGRRLHGLPEAARGLLDLVVVASRPLPAAALLSAARVTAGRSVLRAMLDRALLRVATSGPLAYEPVHDYVRRAHRATLDAARRRALHGALLDALTAMPDTSAHLLVEHAFGAERNDLGADLALRAARAASDALAFGVSAELYALAVRHRPEHTARVGLADALRNDGRLPEAARAYTAAAEACTEPAEADRLWTLAAEQHLRAGDAAEGLRLLRPLLRRHGLSLPDSPSLAALLAMARRLPFFLRRLPLRLPPPRALSATEGARLDLLWSAATALGMIAPALGDSLAMRHFGLAVASGVPARVARALGFEASQQAFFGGSWFRRRAFALADQARAVAIESGDAYADAWTTMAGGIVHALFGDFAQCVTACRAAEAAWLELRVGTDWELTVARTYLNGSLALRGDVRPLLERVPSGLEDAQRRGDRLAAAVHRTGQPGVAWLCLDRPEIVLEGLDVADGPLNAIGYFGILAGAHAELYRGDAAAADALLRRTWVELGRGGFLTFPYCKAELWYLRARTAALTGDRSGARLAARTLGAIRGLPQAEGFAAVAHALVADGDALDQAAVRFDRAGMALHAAATRWRLASRQGGDPAGILADVEQRGVRDPERFLAALVPRPP